jgi:hypothetical protein
MKKRSLFVSVFLGVAFVATAAFAYFTFSATVAGNAIGTGDLTLQTWGGAINASGLMPGGPANVSYMAVQNNNSIPVNVKGFLTNGSGNTEIAQYIHVKVTLNPSTGPYVFPSGARLSEDVGWDYVIFNGSLNDLSDPANSRLTTLGHPAMEPGMGGAYKVEVSLDPSAGNAVKNKTMWCDFVWAAGQVEDAGFAAASSF